MYTIHKEKGHASDIGQSTVTRKDIFGGTVITIKE